MNNPLIANISMLFSDLPMSQRFAKAAEYGFEMVEIQFPYEWPAADLKQWADDAGVSVYLINVPAGDLLKGGRSFSCHPAYQQQFASACKQALEYGQVLGVRWINVLASNISPEDDVEVCWQTYVDNIRYAAELMVYEGIQVSFEAINDKDMPAYLMNSFMEMNSVWERVGHPNAYMQFDIYHMAMMDEDIEERLSEFPERIGHIQFADVPGRGAPNTGSLPLGHYFQQIAQSRYSGAVAAEYKIQQDEKLDYGWLIAAEG